jgi:hypothetical protein
MEADVAKSALGADTAKLTLPIGSQAFIRATRADAEVIHPIGRSAGGHEVSVDYAQRRTRLCIHAQGCHEEREQKTIFQHVIEVKLNNGRATDVAA